MTQLKEAEEILSNSPEEKQVVFFDDVFWSKFDRDKQSKKFRI